MGHCAYDQRIKVIAKMLKESRVVGGGVGGQDGYELRIEVMLKLHKKG